MDFSQRMGLVPALKVAQVNSIDSTLQIALWNVITQCFLARFVPADKFNSDWLDRSNFQSFASNLYSDFYKVPVDTLPLRWSDLKKTIRDSYFEMEWHRLYTFLEFLVTTNLRGTGQMLAEEFNEVLEKENSAFRFVSGLLAPIISSEEIEEVEKAISASDQYAGARIHIQTSLGLLVNRENPDYRNSIKESISAVESLAKKLVGDEKATLGQALKELEKKHYLHSSLKTAFSALYGYTSDTNGIRHSLMDNESQLTKADARFMLICCSAFINFAIDSVED